MSQLVLQLPETLYRQLEAQAKREGISLEQYLTYALTRQLALAYTVQTMSGEVVEQQRAQFAALLQNLGQASHAEIARTLAERQTVEPETGLTPEVVARLQKRIQDGQPHR